MRAFVKYHYSDPLITEDRRIRAMSHQPLKKYYAKEITQLRRLIDDGDAESYHMTEDHILHNFIRDISDGRFASDMEAVRHVATQFKTDVIDFPHELWFS
jgi:hypothetical protein